VEALSEPQGLKALNWPSIFPISISAKLFARTQKGYIVCTFNPLEELFLPSENYLLISGFL